jgi:quercetin dioxygenase-like cupin family protein
MQPVEPAIITIGELEIRYLMDGTVNDAGSGMFELTVPPGAHVPPPHSHADNEEIIYCLEGTLRCSVDGEVRDLKPGEQSYTPRGAVHGFSNPHDRTARVLVVLNPRHRCSIFPRRRRRRRCSGWSQPREDGAGDGSLRSRSLAA